MNKTILKKTVFLDRDGVINKDSPHYIKSWEEFHFIPGSLDAIKMIHEHRFQVILITNQSAVGRGLITLDGLKQLHHMMMKKIRSHNGFIHDIFFCPHTPDLDCDCRKPAPGMIFNAKNKHDIELSQSTMVGDSAKDIECAKNAGCGRSILVKTGNGPNALKQLQQKGLKPEYVAENLFGAVEWIIENP